MPDSLKHILHAHDPEYVIVEGLSLDGGAGPPGAAVNLLAAVGGQGPHYLIFFWHFGPQGRSLAPIPIPIECLQQVPHRAKGVGC